MKQKLLLLSTFLFSLLAVNAQKKKSSSVSAYAITAPQMGQSKWTEVREIDLRSGEVIKTILLNTDKPSILNARTGKPVKSPARNLDESEGKAFYRTSEGGTVTVIRIPGKQTPEGGDTKSRKVIIIKKNDTGPFATNSAACAYDRRNKRLYYTPMGINQLRYIDLRKNEPTVHYFEDEPFGVVKGSYDHANQVTRMTIAGNGKGYALTNNGSHLVEFTTGKKIKITDLGSLSNNASNGRNDVLGGMSHGGDMVADDKGNLYLITANRAVYRVSIDTRVATYLGHIQGLPRNFTTNGAAVESGTKIVVTSSTNVTGYYRFDLNDLKAEKFSEADKVFNASDFANASLVKSGKVKDVKEETPETVQPVTVKLDREAIEAPQETIVPALNVFPNPVTGSSIKVTFIDHAAGRYRINMLDMNGRLIQSQPVNLVQKDQQVELKIGQVAGGTYLLQVTGENGKLVSSEKVLVH